MKIEYCQKCDRWIKPEEKAHIKDGQILCKECYRRSVEQKLKTTELKLTKGKPHDSLLMKEMRKPFRVMFWILVVCIGLALVMMLIELLIDSKDRVAMSRVRQSQRKVEQPQKVKSRAKPEYSKIRGDWRDQAEAVMKRAHRIVSRQQKWHRLRSLVRRGLQVFSRMRENT